MAAATYTPTTSSSGLNKIWRKVQGELQQGLQFMSEEWEALDDLENFDIDWSAREITVPIDINEGAGVASIPEGGYEARPSSPNVEEITLSWVLFNKRFTASKTARWIDTKNPEAELKKQLVYQGMKAVQDLGRHFSDYSYGYSTGVLALTDSDLAGGTDTLTLKDAYGDATTNIDTAAYLAAMFKVGDWVAAINDSTLVTSGIGEITAITAATPSIAVTWNGSASDTTNDLKIVKANSLENTTLAGTDFNKGLVGWLEMLTSTSVHSLASSSVANWSVAYSDTAAGRFSGVKLHRAKDEIRNEGGGKVTDMVIDQGVYRDLIALQQAALRFSDPFAMELDGDVKSKGMKIFSSRRVPPGMVILYDRKSVKRMSLLPKPGERLAWSDGEKIKDQSGYVFCLDFPCQRVVTNRKNLAYFQNQTSQ